MPGTDGQTLTTLQKPADWVWGTVAVVAELLLHVMSVILCADQRSWIRSYDKPLPLSFRFSSPAAFLPQWFHSTISALFATCITWHLSLCSNNISSWFGWVCCCFGERTQLSSLFIHHRAEQQPVVQNDSGLLALSFKSARDWSASQTLLHKRAFWAVSRPKNKMHGTSVLPFFNLCESSTSLMLHLGLRVWVERGQVVWLPLPKTLPQSS